MSVITVYGRPGCHLCDDAVAVLERIRREQPFELRTVNIEDDDDLMRAYLERIPVVALDGAEVYDYEIDAADLRARLARVGRR
jgi:glutaredoxin